MRYSRAALTVFLGTFGIIAGCGRDKKSSSPVAPEAQAAPDTLWVLADSSVAGEPKSGVTTRRRGERVSYRYEAASGFKNAVVVLDSALAPLAGSVTMNGNRRILASAEKIVVVPTEAKPLQSSVTEFLTAPTPAAALPAYTNYTQELEALYAAYGPEQARELAYAAYRAAYDAADEKSIEAAERALEGRLFGGSGEVSFSAPAAASAISVARKNTSLIFVNGILNSVFEAAASRDELKPLVKEAGLANEIEVYNFYNASALHEPDSERKCLRWAIQRENKTAMFLCKASFALGDFVEASRQIAQIFNQLPVGAEPTAKVLARLIKQERGQGRAVILVGHSQGTLMIQQALKELGESDQCVTAISLAGPLGFESWRFWRTPTIGFVVAGERAKDIILALGYNDFPHVATDIALNADQYLAKLENPYTTGVAFMAIERLLQDLRLHHMVKSYAAGKESRDSIRTIVARQAGQLAANLDCRIPTGARIYASSGEVVGGFSVPPSYLWIVPPRSAGVDTVVARIRTIDGFEPIITDIALAPSGELWGVSFDRLYKINQKTGLALPIGQFSNADVNALAFDPSGQLFGATTTGWLIAINTTTGQDGNVGRLGGGFISWGDIVFAPDGRLLATLKGEDGNGFLVKVDLASGRATAIGSPIGFNNIWGLSFVGNVLFGLTTDVASGKGALITIDTATGRGTPVRQLSFKATGAASPPGYPPVP